ncbi:unnamed protein product [Callosobruchus maculatus]|uniref:Uncharacterized protein n=1 Tax=Callosobruchus maculatus TaxID=64391 RepID=A0A653BKP3_CALMS|nr:unnamed protein product [Callosobruchus maculatus]
MTEIAIASGRAFLGLDLSSQTKVYEKQAVRFQKEANSAMLGAGYQAEYGLMKPSMSYGGMMSNLPEPELACEPPYDAAEVYTPMVERYRSTVKELTEKLF